MKKLSTEISFLQNLAADKYGNYEGTLIEHLVGTYSVLRLWGQEEYICMSGLFHSIYGTSSYDIALLPADNRKDLVMLVGEEAEKLVYLYCSLHQESLVRVLLQKNKQYYIFSNRFDKTKFQITKEDFVSLITLTLANDIEILSQGYDNCKDLYRQILKFYYLAKPYLKNKIINFCDEFLGLKLLG